MKIVFDVAHLYYLPQYLSVYRILRDRGASCMFVMYRNDDMDHLIAREVERLGLPHIFVNSAKEALAYYRKSNGGWIIFGNGFDGIDQIPATTKTALINHGAGVKSVGYLSGMNRMDVRFVDGTHHFRELKKAYPDGNQVLVGFSKMDPLLNNTQPAMDLEKLGLDPSKSTLLYAPTFYPSSIELFPDHFPKEFENYNVLVKFHFFSYIKKKYRRQRKKLSLWKSYNNVYAAGPDEYSILPFLKTADLLISDASSTLFEFAALNKPVVWCDFLKLRWTYRGPFRFRYLKRMDSKLFQYRDIAAHVGKYADLKTIVEKQLANPREFEAKRLEYTDMLLGPLDGNSSIRVVDYLLQHG